MQIGDHPADFRTDALRALLAYLAAHQGVPQRRDTLAALLSPDRPDKEALTYLRNRLSRLRSALADDAATPPWFAVDRKEIALRAGNDITIDLTEFEQRLTTVEAHAHRELAGCPTCLARLQEAVALVRGEFLAGLNFGSDTWESWLVGQREYFQQRAVEAMTLLRDVQIERGEWAAVLEVTQRQLMLEPWLEAAHRARMQAHHQLGDRNAALAQYEQCEALLWEELGVEPEEETQQLRQKIFDSAPVEAGSALAGGIGAGGTKVPDNLPLQTSRFFGRKAEQTQLLQRLVDPNYRLITLVGAGGIGKTRLAIEVGQQVKESFSDGVWFVPLDAVKGGQEQLVEQIKIAVGEAAGLGQADKQPNGDQVLAILRDKRMLLIFDNCEVVLDELLFIAEWLKRAPHIAILATSREPLNFAAEAVVLLDGLSVGSDELNSESANFTPSQPPPRWGRSRSLVDENAAPSPSWRGLGRGPAEEMFAEQGRMARARFEIASDELPIVREICQLVDGSPLGISLAAAWVRRRSLTQIIDSIKQSLDFLSTRLRDVEPRHRSMRAVFETSWQLLEAEEQTVLAALAVFPTSFSAEAAAEVAGACLFGLDLLCEKSLLQQQNDGERYIMHSLVRQFAVDKLAARTSDVERRFVDYFYQFACDHQDDYAQLQPEWRNFLAGITKAHAREAWQTVLDFVQALDEPWFRQIRFNEMRAGLALAADAASVSGNQRALASMLLRLGEVEIELNDYGVAETHLLDALDHFMHQEDSLGIAHAKYFLGRIKIEQTQDDKALVFLEASKQIFEVEEDWLGIAKNLNLIAVCQIRKSRDFHSAHAYLEQSVALQQQLPLSSIYVETLRTLARTKVWLEVYVDAENCLVEASTVSRQQQDTGEYAAVLFERVFLCKVRNQFDEALAFGYECLDNFRNLGSLRWEALVKTQLGLLHQAKQEHDQGLVLLTEGVQIFRELGDLYEQAYSYYYLYKLYVEIGDTEQSLNAKQHAHRLNLELNDPQIQERLN